MSSAERAPLQRESIIATTRQLIVDDGLEGARKMMPGPDRVLRYRAIEERILSDVAIIPLYHDLTCVALNPEVSGVDLGPYGMPTLRFSRVYRVPVASGVPTFAEDRP